MFYNMLKNEEKWGKLLIFAEQKTKKIILKPL